MLAPSRPTSVAVASCCKPFLPATSLPLTNIFFFNDTATTEIYTLSLHDALPISGGELMVEDAFAIARRGLPAFVFVDETGKVRSEEHTSELQSRVDLVCRLL